MNKLQKILIIALCLLFISACASDGRMRVLDDSLRAYSSAMRWGDFKGASRFYKNPASISHINFDKLKSIKVTGYDESGSNLSQDRTKLMQSVTIKYYDTGVGKVHELTDNQVWEYDQERRLWLLVSSMPEFKF